MVSPYVPPCFRRQDIHLHLQSKETIKEIPKEIPNPSVSLKESDFPSLGVTLVSKKKKKNTPKTATTAKSPSSNSKLSSSSSLNSSSSSSSSLNSSSSSSSLPWIEVVKNAADKDRELVEKLIQTQAELKRKQEQEELEQLQKQKPKTKIPEPKRDLRELDMIFRPYDENEDHPVLIRMEESAVSDDDLDVLQQPQIEMVDDELPSHDT